MASPIENIFSAAAGSMIVGLGEPFTISDSRNDNEIKAMGLFDESITETFGFATPIRIEQPSVLFKNSDTLGELSRKYNFILREGTGNLFRIVDLTRDEVVSVRYILQLMR